MCLSPSFWIFVQLKASWSVLHVLMLHAPFFLPLFFSCFTSWTRVIFLSRKSSVLSDLLLLAAVLDLSDPLLAETSESKLETNGVEAAPPAPPAQVSTRFWPNNKTKHFSYHLSLEATPATSSWNCFIKQSNEHTFCSWVQIHEQILKERHKICAPVSFQ